MEIEEQEDGRTGQGDGRARGGQDGAGVVEDGEARLGGRREWYPLVGKLCQMLLLLHKIALLSPQTCAS